MNVITKSIQKELNHFYKLIKSGEFDIQHVSKSAFTQARAKLKHTAFVELNDQVVDEFYDTMPWMSWQGRRILSVDGSTIQLPDSPSLRDVYSTHCFGTGEREKVMARISQLYDPLNQVIVHASIGKYVDSEKELCKTHLDYLQSGDVVLFDRYYASIWLFIVLQKIGVDFVVRLNEQWWKSAQDLLKGKVNEKTVEFQVSPNHNALLAEYGIEQRNIKCRLIRSTLSNGEKIVLCTSLLDRNITSREMILELYSKRWAVEESYKTLKCRLDLENFTGKTPHAILQDFYVKILLSNLCSVVAVDQQIEIDERDRDENKKHKYQINKTFALSNWKDIPVFAFLKNKLKQAIQAFRDLIKQAVVPIRPNRSFIRRTSPRKLSKINYKPI